MSYFDDNEARITGLHLGRDTFRNPPRFIPESNKTMQIQVINVSTESKTSSKGTPYDQLEVTFKNLTFQGKVEAKKIMPFGAQKSAFDTLKAANNGDVFDVQVVKNTAGYNDWVAVSQGSAGAEAPAAPSSPAAGKPAAYTPGAKTSTYETSEERAKRQVLIVKQSSLSAAVATLAVGAKSLKPEDVIGLAQRYTDFVFGTDAPGSFEEVVGDII